MNQKHIPLLEVVFDTESGHYLCRVHNYEQTVEHFKQRYGAIGGHMIEIGQLVQRKQFPHFMNTTGWIHVIPKDDILEHVYGADKYECQCAPKVDCLNRVVCHSAMDGRGEYSLNNPKWEVVDGTHVH